MSDILKATPRRRKSWVGAGMVISFVMAFASFVYMMVTAAQMAMSGRGSETHNTFWLVSGSWNEFLIFSAVALLALIGGALFQVREKRQWRELEKKYGQAERDA